MNEKVHVFLAWGFFWKIVLVHFQNEKWFDLFQLINEISIAANFNWFGSF
jgi:hypothetical protein